MNNYPSGFPGQKSFLFVNATKRRIFYPFLLRKIKMRKFLLFVVLFSMILPLESLAQKQDAVYLKNGNILRGKIIENAIDHHTTIQIEGRSVFVCPVDEISKIIFDEPTPLSKREYKASSLEVIAGTNFYGGSDNSAGFNFITAYRFPFRLETGVGTGIEWFNNQLIPFYGDVRYHFLKGAISPYIYGQMGYAMPLSKEANGDYTTYYGGFLAATGAGLRVNFTKHNALVFSIGYRYQRTKTVNSYGYWYYSSQFEEIILNNYKRMSFSMGFVFN
jgi:hypothetical protein